MRQGWRGKPLGEGFVTVRKRMSVGDCSDGVSVTAATKLFVTCRGELTPQDLTHDAHHLIVTFI